MAQNSKIEWTDHTFNPWRGCTKISAGCANCYAETLSKRNPATLGIWGDNGTRVVASESYWRQPLKWNRDAAAVGVRWKVFCASLADVFEDRPELEAPRLRLFELIAKTPNLDWLLLTKRPENVLRLWPARALDYWPDGWANIWLGTTVENQEQADKRIPELLKIPARVRFLSCEPLLGAVDLRLGPYGRETRSIPAFGRTLRQYLVAGEWTQEPPRFRPIDWVIAGGESGPGARPSHPDWFRSLRDQCTAAGVAYFFKQWGEWGPDDFCYVTESGATPPRQWMYPDGQVLNWRGHGSTTQLLRYGKKAAGRLLDGRTWDEFPQPEVSR